jgi:transposase-like protein
MIKVRKSYTIEQKLRIIADAKASDIKQASLKHNIDSSMLYRWMKMEQRLTSAPSNATRKIGSGRKVGHPLAEQQLRELLAEDLSMGLTVTRADLRDKMLELTAPVDDRFKASTGWLTGFKRRSNISLKRVAAKRIKKIPKLTVPVDDQINDRLDFDTFDLIATSAIDSTPTLWNNDEPPIFLGLLPSPTISNMRSSPDSDEQCAFSL